MHINAAFFVVDVHFVVGEGVYVQFLSTPLESVLPVVFCVGESLLRDTVSSVVEIVIVDLGAEAGGFE